MRKRRFAGTLTSIVFALFLMASLGMVQAADANSADNAYCEQKYGIEPRLISRFDYKDARTFDPRCPTWPVLAIGVAAFGSITDLEKMLDAGLSVDGVTFPYFEHFVHWSLLDAAIRGNKADTVKFLLKRGASPALGNPVLLVFMPDRSLEPEQTYAQRLELLDIVLAAGADPNAPCLENALRRGPLNIAADQADLLSVERLLRAGAKADGAICPEVQDYNKIMLPLFFKKSSETIDENLTEAQRKFLLQSSSRLDWGRSETSPLQGALAGDWMSSQKNIPNELELWRVPTEERLARYRRVAVRLVQNGAIAIGLFSEFTLFMGDEPKLISVAIAAARNTGYEMEFIEKLQEKIRGNPKGKDRVAAYLTMLKGCRNKVTEAKDDYFKLCASEE